MKRKEEVQSELHFLWLRQFFLFFNFTIHCIKTSRAFPLPWFYGRKGYISVQIMSFSFGKRKKKTLSDFIFSLYHLNSHKLAHPKKIATYKYYIQE